MALRASSFRRSGPRDDRRRRLLTDELANSEDWPASQGELEESSPSSPRLGRYGDAEFLEQQLRLLDLIPQRTAMVSALLFAGAAVVAGLLAGYAWMLDRVASGAAALAALDLAAKGSLGHWFSSLLLLAATYAALSIYTIRRHRADDYQGRYRIWLWAAVCWFVLATDQAAGLHEAFRDLMIMLTGTPLIGNGDLWWAILVAFVAGAVGSRMFMDMHADRLATGCLTLTALVYGAALAGAQGWLPLENVSRQAMVVAGIAMVGHLLLATAMFLHARHVLWDAQGLLPEDEPLPDEDALRESPADAHPRGEDRWTQVDPPHSMPRPTHQQPIRVTHPSSANVPATINRKLTKQEKKALKERLLRERAARGAG